MNTDVLEQSAVETKNSSLESALVALRSTLSIMTHRVVHVAEFCTANNVEPNFLTALRDLDAVERDLTKGSERHQYLRKLPTLESITADDVQAQMAITKKRPAKKPTKNDALELPTMLGGKVELKVNYPINEAIPEPQRKDDFSDAPKEEVVTALEAKSTCLQLDELVRYDKQSFGKELGLTIAVSRKKGTIFLSKGLMDYLQLNSDGKVAFYEHPSSGQWFIAKSSGVHDFQPIPKQKSTFKFGSLKMVDALLKGFNSDQDTLKLLVNDQPIPAGNEQLYLLTPLS
ncbi:hypothetical protein [Tellurirhabdus bombi]|uniref:hypothetical protein n=1 Tax=Tellurirhabdus bombi TaxID=2907205 RepID=UPI001F1C3EB2|nr:hypothetical protein [Tellurirhabdus bombi]